MALVRRDGTYQEYDKLAEGGTVIKSSVTLRKNGEYLKWCKITEARMQMCAAEHSLAPNVLEVVRLEKSPSVCFMRMQAVGKYTLSERARHRLEERKAYNVPFVLSRDDILHLVARAIEYHYLLQTEAGILLRDLSALNVVVRDDDSDVTLIDFGVADWVRDLRYPEVNGNVERLDFIDRLLKHLNLYSGRAVEGLGDIIKQWAMSQKFIGTESGVCTRSRGMSAQVQVQT